MELEPSHSLSIASFALIVKILLWLKSGLVEVLALETAQESSRTGLFPNLHIYCIQWSPKSSQDLLDQTSINYLEGSDQWGKNKYFCCKEGALWDGTDKSLQIINSVSLRRGLIASLRRVGQRMKEVKKG